jgi:sugar/nucleoside kinase (ribokinase family)
MQGDPPPTSPTTQPGLIAAGNFIVDHVKLIDAWPEEQRLATILSSSSHNGGGPYNVLKDLAALGAPFPLHAIGRVGDDPDGRWILADCQGAQIGTSHLSSAPGASTSYTDAMTSAANGRRTFFHHRGANATLSQKNFPSPLPPARLFHLAYLLLLDSLDELLPDGTTGASQVLAAAAAAGLETSVDVVSASHPMAAEITRAALPHTHRLIVNEIEAAMILRRPSPKDPGPRQLADLASALLDLGVLLEVVVHAERGAAAATSDGETITARSLDLPQGFIKGATGAGDAFAAGYLFATHEGWPIPRRLTLAAAAAAACLSHPSASGGVLPLEHCLALAQIYPPLSS